MNAPTTTPRPTTERPTPGILTPLPGPSPSPGAHAPSPTVIHPPGTRW